MRSFNLQRAHQAAPLRTEGRKTAEFRGDASNRDAFNRSTSIGNLAVDLRLQHDSSRKWAGPPHRPRIVDRDARVVSNPVEILVAWSDGILLNAERIGSGLTQDCIPDRRVQPPNQGHDRNDRRNRDDVAEDRHDRLKLERPDRFEGEASRFNQCVHECPTGPGEPVRAYLPDGV